MARRRGDSNWASGYSYVEVPHMATAFEEQVRKLGLNAETCANSAKLRHWCERNKDHCYIPERLLDAWGLSVEPRFTPVENQRFKCKLQKSKP